MGYKTKVSPPGPDRGIDMWANKDDLWVTPPTIIDRQQNAIALAGNLLVIKSKPSMKLLAVQNSNARLSIYRREYVSQKN